MLPQHERLKRREDFQNLRQKGKRYNRRCLSLVALKTDTEDMPRVGFIVTKRLSKKAVTRNRIKRQMRAAYHLHRHHLKKGYFFLFIARQAILDQPFQTLNYQIESLLHEAGAISSACIES